ncbi:MAG: hypothetical protein MJ237_08450 [bacterium]|nr:hypothetical protein [bacterium]
MKIFSDKNIDVPLKIQSSLFSSEAAFCSKIYSNISFGNNKLRFANELNIWANHYKDNVLIVSMKNNFTEKLFSKLFTNNHKPLIVFIEGPSGCGKSSQAKVINNILNETSTLGNLPKSIILSGDNFYIPNDDLMKDANYVFVDMIEKHPERETPIAFNIASEYQVLNNLRYGESPTITIPQYDYKTAKVISKKEIIRPANLVIFDGLYAPKYFDFDFRIFIDTKRTIRDKRVGGQRFKERTPKSKNPELEGKKLAEIVGDVHDKFILPNKTKADIVISGNHSLDDIENLYKDFFAICRKYVQEGDSSCKFIQ